jgi:hypothetical protein
LFLQSAVDATRRIAPSFAFTHAVSVVVDEPVLDEYATPAPTAATAIAAAANHRARRVNPALTISPFPE